MSDIIKVAVLIGLACWLEACNERDTIINREPTEPDTIIRDRTKPNIIIILADDLGYNDLSLVSTPNIDRLYKQGLVYNNFHSNPTCTPSRVSLLTGRYPQNFGLQDALTIRKQSEDVGLDDSAMTIFEYLKELNYHTAMFGKWHLGWKEKYSPLRHGFDEWIGFKGGNVDYQNKIDNGGNYDWFRNDEPFEQRGYVTTLISENARNFILKNKDQPFAIYLPFPSPHWPIQGPDDPARRFLGGGSNDWPVSFRKSSYFEMISELDQSIGRILSTLEENFLAENTLIFFGSDNGLYEVIYSSGIANNSPLRGFKGSLFEGGVLCPAVFYWPSHLTSKRSMKLAHLMDVAPTILSAIGVETKYMDGIDLLGAVDQTFPRELYQRTYNQKSLTRENYKIILTNKGEEFMFKIDTDLEEQINLAKVNDSLFFFMKEKLLDWEEQW